MCQIVFSEIDLAGLIRNAKAKPVDTARMKTFRNCDKGCENNRMCMRKLRVSRV